MSTRKGCLTRILNLFRADAHPTNPAPLTESGPLPYRLSDRFLSPAELSFYQVLRTCLDQQQVVISPKVRLGDLFFVSRGVKGSERRVAYNRIAKKHVDFVLCDPRSMRPLLGIELDDSSHQRSDRAERDCFVDRVFDTAKLPLLHVSVQEAYRPQEVKAAVYRHLESIVPESDSHTRSNDGTPLCPKCGLPMVLRTALRGKRVGEQFYGCQNYPDCREIIGLE